MKKRISHISVLQQGIVCAVLYGLLSLIAVPFLILGALFGHGGAGAILFIFLPIVYAIVGFIAGVITAFVYNLVAGWTGGIELTFSDAPQQ
jgi:hypothetical protein